MCLDIEEIKEIAEDECANDVDKLKLHSSLNTTSCMYVGTISSPSLFIILTLSQTSLGFYVSAVHVF